MCFQFFQYKKIIANGEIMTRNEKYIARVMFKLKLYESDGQKFEDLFVKVMCKANPNFKPVKAHGRIGDMKNDGFDRTTGTYYQVFAPEDVKKGSTINDAVAKVKEDFQGLKIKWNDICPIKEFFYVVNDKYKGIPAPITQELIQLNNANSETKCDTFASKNLEDSFILLNDDDIIDVISFIPDENIGALDYSVLNEAIIYIRDYTGSNGPEDKLVVPDFEEKIEFNKLSDRVNHFLTFASYQIGDLEEFFKVNSDFVKSELQASFKEIYEESKSIIPDTIPNFSDERFFYILKQASARKEKAYRDAVLVLMAYYFESCDIFEEPVKVGAV
ncbi:hypothetical protein D3C86_1200590 [compost metagenome]